MTLLEINDKITPDRDKTNIIHHFTVPQGIKKLTVAYKYSPKRVEDKELAKKAVASGMKKYGVTFANPERFMPVNNLVTLSFDENGRYRGACHRQQNEQTVVISEKRSTPGIINGSVEPGDWDVMLNIHYIGCAVQYSILITGEAES